MRFRSYFALTSALFITIGFATGASAQAPAPKEKAAPKAAPAAPAAQPPQQSVQAQGITSPWNKRCVTEPNSKKQICEISQVFVAETGQVLMSVRIQEMQDNPRKGLTIMAPMGMLLPPGMRAFVDQQQLPSGIPYLQCVTPAGAPPGCVGEMEIDAGLIAAMKKSQVLRIQTMNGQGKTIDFVFPTKEFAKAYDGPAIDEKAMEAENKKMKDMLQKKADELAKSQQK
jgi:invasion protein IalB